MPQRGSQRSSQYKDSSNRPAFRSARLMARSPVKATHSRTPRLGPLPVYNTPGSARRTDHSCDLRFVAGSRRKPLPADRRPCRRARVARSTVRSNIDRRGWPVRMVPTMSAFGGKADMTFCSANVCYDPKRTSSPLSTMPLGAIPSSQILVLKLRLGPPDGTGCNRWR